MGLRVTRQLALETPVAAETLWKQLAEVLPWLVRFFVEESYARYEDPPKTVGLRPAIHGPFGNRYSSSELGVHGHTDLLAGNALVLTITAATVSSGLIVLTLSSTSQERLDRLSLELDPQRFDAVVEILNREVKCSLTS